MNTVERNQQCKFPMVIEEQSEYSSLTCHMPMRQAFQNQGVFLPDNQALCPSITAAMQVKNESQVQFCLC